MAQTKTALAVANGTTKYGATVVAPRSTTILKHGKNNTKLGGVVTRGALMGAEIYSLSLEERATCPRSCPHWGDKDGQAPCYGNNMPFAHRIDHRHPEFYSALEEELMALTKKHRRVLVRLHVLGDFFDRHYIRFWHTQLQLHDNLHAFGYTAWHPTSELGYMIDDVVDDMGWDRFAIRHSGLDSDVRSALVGDNHADISTFWCPEQVDKAASCADCGACWEGMKTVRFLEH